MDSASAPAPGPPAPASGVKFVLRALRHRNYRLFFAGQGVSLIGTWLTTTATSWLVLRLATQANARLGAKVIAAATVLGIVRFAAQIPMSLLAPAAGVLIDRWNRHRVLVATQALSMIQSVLLAWLTFSGRINISQIIGLSIFQGLINAFDAPARQAFVVEIVEDRADLPNAIALNSSMFNGARLLGPAVAGIMIARLGEGWCFAIDAVSYLAVLIALLLMTLPPRVVATRAHSAWRELADGFRYAAGFAPVRALLFLAGLTSVGVAAFQTLMPIFADRIAPNPDRGAAIFGFLGAAVGVGSLAGAIFLAARRHIVGLGRIIATGAALAGVAMIAFAATRSLPFMLATAALGGFGMIVTFAASNTLLQTIVDDHMRGRLMSLYIVAVMGASPLGSLIAGWVADRIGDAVTVMVCGGICVIAAILFLLRLPRLRELVHPIYVRKGIIPQVATGLAAADRLNTADER